MVNHDRARGPFIVSGYIIDSNGPNSCHHAHWDERFSVSPHTRRETSAALPFLVSDPRYACHFLDTRRALSSRGQGRSRRRDDVATRAYLEAHGKPVAFYSDKHNIFRVNNGEGGERVTQFGRALEALNIDIICANSPQAKGRVERAFGTLQDRLVKELRLAGISSMEAANTWLPGFIAGHNARFRNAEPHAALRPDDADPGANAAGAQSGTQEGGSGELSGRTVRGAVQRQIAAVSDVRQDPDCPAWHNRRQQAAIGGAGDGEGAPGGIRAETTARACGAAAATE